MLYLENKKKILKTNKLKLAKLLQKNIKLIK